MKIFWGRSFLLLIILVFLLLGFWNTKNILFDNSQWFTKEHPQKKNLDYLNEEYDKGEKIIFLADLQEDYFQPQWITATKNITKKLEALDNVLEVQTPLNATIAFSNNESLNIFSFSNALEKGIIPNLNAYRQKIQQSFYYKHLISQDFQKIAFVIKIKKDDSQSNSRQREMLVQQAKEVFRIQNSFQNLAIIGEVMLNYSLDFQSKKNLKILLPLAIILILILLTVVLVLWQHIFLVVITALLGLFLSFYVLVFQNHLLTVIGLALPVMILVITIADSIHIVSRWNLLVVNGTPIKKAASLAIWQTWLPCLGTSVTTAIGFGSFYFSNLIPLSNFGWDSFWTILLSYFLIIFTNWIMLTLFCNQIVNHKKREYSWVKVFVQKCLTFSQKFQKPIVYFSFFLIIILLYQLKYIRIETNFLDVFFQKKSTLYQDFLFADKHFSGTGNIDAILTQKESDFKSLSEFQKIKEFKQNLLFINNIKSVQSYLDPIKMIHQEFTAKSQLPTNQQQLEQELLFLEFSRGDKKTDVISNHILFDYSESRVHIQTPNLNSQQISQLKEKIVTLLKNLPSVSFLLTGSSIFAHALSEEVLKTQLVSMVITISITGLIFVFLFGIKLGFLALIASVFPILLTSGVIIALKIPFDFAVILIGSISFGLCVDDTIHLLHNYKKQKGNISEKLQKATQSLSHPLVFTSLLFIIGSGVFLSSDLVVLIKFGFFTSFAILGAFFSTVVLLPALLTFFNNQPINENE